MTRRSPVPSSLAFEGTARGTKFRDRIAVGKASPETTFRAAPGASGAAEIRQPRGVRDIRRSRPRKAVHERARGADRPPG